MSRIFSSLCVVSTILLIVALVLGLNIDDAKELSSRGAVSNHMLMALAALVFALLVHAILLTYFMGTGRWLEETSNAYKLSPDYCERSAKLKYSTIPLMTGALFLLIVTGAFGAASDPLSRVQFQGWLGLSAAQIHYLIACLTVGTNVVVNLLEYLAIHQNGQLIKEVLGEVRRIRQEHGLPV
ncbi:MAG: hypothetical protein P8M30_01585 [Planctomycetaceae bacterium]|nr:hypothetical protein [Planctomycetaceae bacterium]MDG2387986.1 hypothetical protein [Planctomycetaceae bacterium]